MSQNGHFRAFTLFCRDLCFFVYIFLGQKLRLHKILTNIMSAFCSGSSFISQSQRCSCLKPSLTDRSWEGSFWHFVQFMSFLSAVAEQFVNLVFGSGYLVWKMIDFFDIFTCISLFLCFSVIFYITFSAKYGLYFYFSIICFIVCHRD